MFIVYEGDIEVILVVDESNEIPIGHLSRGSIARSNHFLTMRESKVILRAGSRSKIFTLKQEVIVLLSLMYTELYDHMSVTLKE
jgi:hypothetical protein